MAAQGDGAEVTFEKAWDGEILGRLPAAGRRAVARARRAVQAGRWPGPS